MNRQVYLDHNASTPVHPEVVDAMLPYFSERFGNPSSVHGFGRAAREGLETAREQVAHFLRVGKEEIVFTSGGTESDNMAVKGVAMARRSGHIITSKIEHHAVLRAVQNLETMGFDATYLDVDGFGMVDPDALRRAIRPDTILISIMHANSEIGTVQPARELGAIAREHNIPFHMDAVQTFGKVPIDLDAFNIDMLSFSGHKIYGPKGVAGLYIRKGTKMVSVQHGGEHERRRRAGTENVAGIVGFGKAVEVRGRIRVSPRLILGGAPPTYGELFGEHELMDGRMAEAALLFTCNGRGSRLFGVPDHDAEVVADSLGHRVVSGMSCAGELGPVGGRNFLHGFTASIVLLGSRRR